MAEEVFDIRMEKMNDHTSDSKYAIIGFFAEKQRRQNELVSRAASAADPEAAQDVPAQRNAAKKSPSNGIPAAAQNIPAQRNAAKKSPSNGTPAAAPEKACCTLSNILAESTAEQWLLALIAFLLFINLICKS